MVGGTPIVLPLSSILINLDMITNVTIQWISVRTLSELGVHVSFLGVSNSLINLEIITNVIIQWGKCANLVQSEGIRVTFPGVRVTLH